MTLHFDPKGYKTASLIDMRIEFARGFMPARELGVLEAVERHIRVPSGIGLDGVPFSWNRVPYLRGVAEAFASPDYEMVALMGGAQITGKTALLQALALGFCGHARRSDAKIVHFTQNKGREFTHEKLDRMIMASPDIRAAMNMNPGDFNVFDKSWRSGAFLRITWPTVENLSSSSTPFMLLTDRDRMADTLLGASSVDGKRSAEGAPEQLALNRTQQAGDEGCVLVESTPGRDNRDPTWKPEAGSHMMPPVDGIGGIYNSGDRRRYQVPCPHCDTAFEPKFETLLAGKSGDALERAAATVMVCPNGCVIDSDLKSWMNLRGEHMAEGQTATVEHDVMHYGNRLDKAVVIHGKAAQAVKTASFHIPVTMASATHYPWSEVTRTHAEAEATLESTGSEEGLRDFTLTKVAMPYTPRAVVEGAPMDAESLQARAREQAKRTVPDFVRFLVTTVDVQGDRFVVQVQGWGADYEVAIIDRYNLKHSKEQDEDGKSLSVSPGSRPDDWSLLTPLMEKTYPLDNGSGRVMRNALTFCDFQGVPGASENAIAYKRKMDRDGYSKRFALLRGDPAAGKKRKGQPIRLTYPDTSRRTDRKGATRGDVGLWQLDPNYWKDVVSLMLNTAEPGPGYVHIPSFLGKWFFEEMTAEAVNEKGQWTKHRKANEAFDLLCYARAVLVAMLVHKVDWSKPSIPFCKPHDENPLVFMPGESAPVAGTSVWEKMRVKMGEAAKNG